MLKFSPGHQLMWVWPYIRVSMPSVHPCWGFGGQVKASGPLPWPGFIAEWYLWCGWSHNPTRAGSFSQVRHCHEMAWICRSMNANATLKWDCNHHLHAIFIYKHI